MTLTLSRLAAAAALAGAVGLAASTAGAQNRFVFANESNYDTLDPHQAFDVGRVAVRLNMYDGLYRWLDNPPKLEPWLAESHQVSADRLSWTFKMRRGVKFHDGSEIKAGDVVYSAERILAVKKGAAALVSTMLDPGQTRALDDYTVQFTLKKPSAIFLSVVPEIHVVNSALVKKNHKGDDWGQAWLSSNDAGSGSYVLERHDPAFGFSATRNPNHFVKWGPKYFDAIEFRGVLEGNTRLLGTLRGDFHGAGGYFPEDQVKRLRDNAKTKVLEAESMRIMMFQLHNQRAPLSDVNVRKAINHAFNYDAFIKDILQGTVERNPTPIPNNLWGIPRDIKGYTYDPAKAKEYLAQAKAKVDRPLEIAFLTGFGQTEQAAVLMQNGLKQIGIESKVVGNPWPASVEKMKVADTSPDMIVYWISTYYPDPHNWIGEMFHSGQWGTFKSSSFYKNAKVDELLDTALRSTDQAVREKAYSDAARIVYDEAAGVWIYNTKWFGPYARNVQGIRFSPIGSGQEMRWAYFE